MPYQLLAILPQPMPEGYKNNFYSLTELENEFNITLSQDKKSWEGVPVN
jgi:hypothetical protein